MDRAVRIAIAGDFNPESHTHRATNAALLDAAQALDLRLESKWLATSCLARDAARILRNYDGVLIAPGSPYRSMEGALAAIQFARTGLVPLLGTCGGFQHSLLEFARNVMGLDGAQSAEHGVASAHLIVTLVDCPMPDRPAGAPSLHGSAGIHIRRGTRAAEIYGRGEAFERYFCSYEVNPMYRESLEAAGLVLSGFSANGDVRMAELPMHPFFMATLFQPQLSSEPGNPHPLIVAFVRAAEANRATAAIHRPTEPD